MVKKVSVISTALMVVALLATLLVGMVMADPTDGQKVPVVVTYTPIPGQQITIERFDTEGNTSHREISLNYTVRLFIGDAVTPLVGKVVGSRSAMWMHQKDGLHGILHDYYVFSFPTEGGGFEGNAILLFTDYVSSASYTVHMIHGVFHGTGTFEGQTLTAGRDEGPPSMTWTGYLLKP